MLKRLPDLFYNFSSRPLDSDYLLVKNIWRRAQILVEYKSQVTLFTEENVRDGERPEDVATRLYRNPFYNWTILVINDITDVYSQWPKSVIQLQNFINDKYDNPMGTKHHVTTEVKDNNDNIIVPAGKVVASNYQISYYNGSTTVTATPVASVTNATYETELNSKKQNIQVVKPELIEDFVSVYYDIANKGKNERSVTSAADITMD